MSSATRIEQGLGASPLVRMLREQPGLSEGGCWIVGGAVRDAGLGRPIGDLDLAVAGEPADLARAIARALGATVFELSDRHATWRIAASDGGWTIDIAALRAPAIEEDLRLRDFTVNALAVPLSGGPVLDPTGGLADLQARRVRATSERSFEDDPLRTLRAARIAAELGFGIEESTTALAQASAARAAEPAGERRFAELRAMVCGPDPLAALAAMDDLGLTPVVLPELWALRGVEQSANHHLDVHGHTIEVLRRWLAVERDLEAYVGDLAAEVDEALAEPLADGLVRREGIRFAAILHDVGKPATRTERGGVVGFRGHDAVGAEMVAKLCRELRTSRRFADYVAALTRHHLVLGFMVHERPLPRRRIWDYLQQTGTEAIDVTMLTVADRLSAQGSGVPQEAIDGHLELARLMLSEALELRRQGPPRPLLGGGEVAELLGVVPGPRVGEALRELACAQFAGEVSTPQQAREHLLRRERSFEGRGG